MRTLIVGIGALGGLIAVRMRAAGIHVSLATRNAESAAAIAGSGLRLTGVGGDATASAPDAAPLDAYLAAGDTFDLIVLATKAHDAIRIAPSLLRLLRDGGTILPIQNGSVAEVLVDRLGPEAVLGGLSNFGVTMNTPGHYEQRNDGHLIVGELSGGASGRAERVCHWLGTAVETRASANLRGAIWSKLLLNCSVTTLGAIAGQTMRRYIESEPGREIFHRTYDEALGVGLASGARPEHMIVNPVPPTWDDRAGRSPPAATRDAWRAGIVAAYGDLKPSMLQDFERGRPTEIDYINGHIVTLGRRLGIQTPANASVVEVVRAITRGEHTPDPVLLQRMLRPATAVRRL